VKAAKALLTLLDACAALTRSPVKGSGTVRARACNAGDDLGHHFGEGGAAPHVARKGQPRTIIHEGQPVTVHVFEILVSAALALIPLL
jgi:hypothetical protein